MSSKRKLDRSAVFKDILGSLGSPLVDTRPSAVALDLIDLNPNQPRRYFDPEAQTALADSIRQRGVLQPIILRPIEDRYRVVAGERRTRAAREAGLTEIAAVILDITDYEAMEIARLEHPFSRNGERFTVRLEVSGIGVLVCQGSWCRFGLMVS